MDMAGVLDRSSFSSTLQLVGLRIAPQQCTAMQKQLQGHIFHRAKVRPIIPDPNGEPSRPSRLLLLSEAVTDTELHGLPDELRDYVLSEGAVPVLHELLLGYDVLSVEQVLRSIIPAGMDVPSAFEQVGHIAHINLKAEQLPYKAVIGQVLLDKNSRIRTVVNKVDSISNEFRVFPMEVIAGDEDFVTQVACRRDARLRCESVGCAGSDNHATQVKQRTACAELSL